MSWYTNMAGQRFGLPERALEPRDCWKDAPEGPCDEGHDKEEHEL